MRVRINEPTSEHRGLQLEALPRDVLGEATEVADLVADPLRRHERAETVARDDELLLLEQLQRLTHGHHRDAVAAARSR